VSAAELPAMSGIASADPGAIEAVRRRLDAGLRRIAFFVVPSAVAFLALGDVVVGAILRVALTTMLGYAFAIPLPLLLGVAPEWGTAGLTASAGIAGWVEMLLLRATLNARIGRTGLPAVYLAQLWGSAIAAAAIAWSIKIVMPPLHPVIVAIAVLGPYGVVFLAMTLVLQIPEASTSLARLRR
jgi:putative peptidoglycan lipid II flippase